MINCISKANSSLLHFSATCFRQFLFFLHSSLRDQSHTLATISITDMWTNKCNKIAATILKCSHWFSGTRNSLNVIKEASVVGYYLEDTLCSRLPWIQLPRCLITKEFNKWCLQLPCLMLSVKEMMRIVIRQVRLLWLCKRHFRKYFSLRGRQAVGLNCLPVVVVQCL